MSRKKSNAIRQGEPPKTPKVWEKARREKMKIYFNELQEVLPLYDPSAPMSRFEILQKSRSYIKELQNQNQDLLNGGFDEVYKSKMEKLKQRVKELLQRVDQLSDLLRRANIMIPPQLPCSDKAENLSLSQKWMNQRPKKWTEKINVVVPDEKIENILYLIKDFKKKNSKAAKKQCKSYEKQSDNKGPSASVIKTPSFSERIELKKKKQLKKKKSSKLAKVTDINCDKSGSDTFTDSQSPSHTKENQPVDFNLPNNEESSAEVSENADKNNQNKTEPEKVNNKNIKTVANDKINIVTGKVKNLVEPQSNVFLPASTNVVQGNTFFLTNDGNLVQFPILNSSGNVFRAKANLLTQTAIVNQGNTGLLTPLVINRPSPVIVLQKPAPQIIQTAQIVNQPQILSVPNQNIQIVGNSIVCATSTANTKTLPYILSKEPPNKKRITKDSTMTTFVNKIPIPALSKQSYVKKTVNLGHCVGAKAKSNTSKSKESKEKSGESEKTEAEGEVQSSEKEIQTEKCLESQVSEEPEKNKEKEVNSYEAQKRSAADEESSSAKKQKIVNDAETDNNVFKPIENPILSDPPSDGLFCNLKLPTSMGHNLSVSPTAAFLSTFPIVASSKFEDELAKIDDRRTEDKEGKLPEDKNKSKEISSAPALPSISNNKECDVPVASKEQDQESTKEQTVVNKGNCDMNIVSSLTTNTGGNSKENDTANSNSMIGINQCPQLMNTTKSWDEYQKNCEARSDPFYVHTDVQNPVPPPIIPDVPNITFPETTYKNPYPQSNMKTTFNVQNTLTDQVMKNNQFDYGQKDNFNAKKVGYGDRNVVKKCGNDNYISKNQPAYQSESTPNYQLIPVKEMPNQRNSRPPVNWMTDPDVRSRSMSYGTAKIPPYTQPDIFYSVNNQKPQTEITNDYVLTDVNKVNYQKNDFYPKDVQMKAPCKNVEKRTDAKYPAKTPTQNSYNIFDYNYNGNYFGEDDGNKFCNVQNFQIKNKKSTTTNAMAKKKDAVHAVNPDQGEAKRNPDQIITNLDFNPVGNQECFSWVPGKNVEWLPSKSFVDTNLILPSTLPTLVGDLALGTTTANETPKGNRMNQSKTLEASGKTYIDVGFGSNAPFTKEPENNKQYLEPFTNLSKNIFDVTPTNNTQNTQLLKNDCDKNSYNANETIVLKNIFELPVSKSFNDFSNRNKQRPVNNTQNTFLSVSQLVETPNYDNSIKNEGAMENVAKPAEYSQNYNYHSGQKSYKNKARNYKYNDRKYHTYKNTSSNYTAEALIRSNANLPYQGNEFQPEVNTNFYTGKPAQKTDNFPTNETAAKPDFIPCSTQNIYADFNFSSPVPNFNISTSVGTDFVAHDNNYSAQNNTFFGDFIPPEYQITESVPNALLLPPCSIGLQNPFIIEKRNATPEKAKTQGKHYSNSRSRKNFDCSKTNYSDFSIHNTSAGIFTNASITCPTIFTTTSCQNLLPQNPIPDPNITFTASSFTTGNITFPPLASNANANYHRPTATVTNNTTTAGFFPATCHSMFTTCSTTTVSSSRTCLSTIPPTSSSSSVITTPFSVGNTFPSSTQSLPFLSLSNPIIPPSAPSTSGNTLTNFNLSTIFPEINQKGNYHYP